MKPGLSIGDMHELCVQVREEMCARFEETMIHPLYATASMLNHMEWVARQHILPYLETGEEGVGYEVSLKHLAPTPIGATVRVRSTVIQISPRRIKSHLEAWHGAKKIGEGTLVQALVWAEQLYQSAIEEPEANLHAVEWGAELVAGDGQTRFLLEILKWEMGLLPCTRYDEWLVCRMAVCQGAQTLVYREGPFLLRFELEEWLDALRGLAQGACVSFQSDFLEPLLRVQMQVGAENSGCEVRLQVSPQGDEPVRQEQILAFSMQVDAAMIQQFADALHAQLEAFPSRL